MGSGEGGEKGTAGESGGDGSGGHGWFLGWGGIYKVEMSLFGSVRCRCHHF